jgi:hypothetical protein
MEVAINSIPSETVKGRVENVLASVDPGPQWGTQREDLRNAAGFTNDVSRYAKSRREGIADTSRRAEPQNPRNTGRDANSEDSKQGQQKSKL